MGQICANKAHIVGIGVFELLSISINFSTCSYSSKLAVLGFSVAVPRFPDVLFNPSTKSSSNKSPCALAREVSAFGALIDHRGLLLVFESFLGRGCSEGAGFGIWGALSEIKVARGIHWLDGCLLNTFADIFRWHVVQMWLPFISFGE